MVLTKDAFCPFASRTAGVNCFSRGASIIWGGGVGLPTRSGLQPLAATRAEGWGKALKGKGPGPGRACRPPALVASSSLISN